MTRAEVLDGAKACVCQNREQEYGAIENNFAMIADMWSVYLGVEITPGKTSDIPRWKVPWMV